MVDLAEQGIDCAHCAGTCCTFVANSMQIDGDEADALAAAMPEAEWRSAALAAIARLGLDRPLCVLAAWGRRGGSCPG